MLATDDRAAKTELDFGCCKRLEMCYMHVRRIELAVDRHFNLFIGESASDRKCQSREPQKGNSPCVVYLYR